MQIAVLGRIAIVLVIAAAVLGVVGMLLAKRKAKRGDKQTEPKNVTGNFTDLNDQFNRARYMEEDGK